MSLAIAMARVTRLGAKLDVLRADVCNKSPTEIGSWVNLFRKILTTVVGILLGLAIPTASAETLHLVSGPDYRPFADYPDRIDNGGMAREIIESAFAHLGDDSVVDWKSWADGLRETMRDQYDGTFPYFHTEWREQVLVYSDSVYEVIQRLFVMVEGGVMAADADDLVGLQVCSPVGYAVAEPIQALIDEGVVTRNEPDDMVRCFELLALGQVDGVLANEHQGWEQVEANPELDRFAVATAPWQIHINTLSLIAPRLSGEASCRRVMKFNAALAWMRQNGEYYQIVQRWLGASAQDVPEDEVYRMELDDGSQVEGIVSEFRRGIFLIEAVDGTIHPVLPDEIVVFRRATMDRFADSDVYCRNPQTIDPQIVEEVIRAHLPTDEPDLVLSGAAVLADLLVEDLVRAFAADRGVENVSVSRSPAGYVLQFADAGASVPAIVEVRRNTSEDGLADLAAGRADIALADRPIEPSEAALISASEAIRDSRAENVIALQSIAVVVHPGNPIDEINLSSLADLVSGRVNDWSSLGGSGSASVHGLASVDLAAEFLSPWVGTVSRTPAARLHDDVEDLVAAIESDRGAIGLVPAPVPGSANVLRLRSCDAAYLPRPFTAKTEEYPLVRRLYMYRDLDTVNPHVGEFVGFAESDAGQEVVRESGLGDLRISTQSEASFKEALRNMGTAPEQQSALVDLMHQNVVDARRLSTTFRFATGSDELDARAEEDARRLAAYLRAAGHVGSDVLLFGFADSRGPYETNRLLSGERANSVARRLSDEQIRGVETIAMSEELPVACNELAGMSLNRRVEVWVRQ